MFEVGGHIKITSIYSRVSEYDLFRNYCNGFTKIGERFSSEFREDSNPSCVIRVSRLGNLYYRDYGETECYSPLDYICRKYSISLSNALAKINHDFSLGLSSLSSTDEPVIKKIQYINPSQNKRTIIRYRSRKWNNQDKQYWLPYGIHQKTLEQYGVIPITHFWINNKIFACSKISPSYIYKYYEDMFKVYQPKSKVGRWYSNNDPTVVQGIKVLPKRGDLLIITSSLKDVMVLRELGYWAIAPISETSFIPIKVLNKLKERWDRVVLFFDNDWEKEENTGLSQSIKFSKEYDISYILLPSNSEKDISDYRKKFGELKTRKILKKMLITWDEYIAS